MSPSQATNFGAIATFLFGLAFGSFLNVVIYRVPRGQSVVKPRSACPNCGTQIGAFDNIPVLSWIFLRGKCRYCRHPISVRYTIVELLCAFLFLSAYFYAAPVIAPGVGMIPVGMLIRAYAPFIKLCVFFFLLIPLIFIDYEHHLLPDVLTIPGLVLGLIFSLLVPVGGMPVFLIRKMLALRWPIIAVSAVDALAGALIGALFIYAVGEIYFRLRHIEGMGLGDVKLMAMVGAFLGARLALFVIFTGALLGTIFGLITTVAVWRKRIQRRQKHQKSNVLSRSWRSARLMLRYYEVPFGVFLGSMAIVSVFIGNRIVNWYLGLYH